MRPALVPGDRLLIRRTRRPRVGAVVALVDPRDETRVLVKRVASVDGDRIVVLGDNPGASTDSRSFGPVPRGLVIGVAVYRYAPTGRSTRIRRGAGTMQPVATRRLDAILAPDYLQRLTEISIEELRTRRSECQAIEVSLSYSRRVVQGRLDIVLAELKHRQDGTTSNLRSLVEELPEILSERVHAGGFGRMSAFMAPGDEAELEPALAARIDAVADDRRLGNLTGASRDEVDALVDELRSLEVEISAQRKALFERIDTLQDELVRRYKSGEADPTSLLS